MSTLVFTGGPILTMGGQDGPVEAVAVADGKVVGVGPLREVLDAYADADAEVVQLQGRTLVPGFVDPHCHPLMHGQVYSWVDVSPDRVSTIDELVETLARHAAQLPPGAAVRGFGYEPGRLAERRHPDRHDLDRIAGDREVYVMNVSGHGGVVNSRTLSANRILAGTPDPAGGRIGRDADGAPDGRIWDAACDLITGASGVKTGTHAPNFHLSDPDEVLDGQLAAAQETFLAHGVTCVGDTQVTRREMAAWQRARRAGTLRLRVSCYVLSAFLPQVLDLGLATGLGDDRLRIAGVKFYTDGAFGCRTVYLPDGYVGEPDRHGQLYHEPAEFSRMVAETAAAGLQAAIHAQGSYAIGMAIDAVRAAPDSGLRHRVEHCALPTPDQARWMAKLGMWAVFQPSHHTTTGDWVAETVGPDVENYSPAGMYQQCGAGWALSSDAPVAWPNPMEAIAAAVERRTVAGRTLGPQHAVTPAQALRAHTLDAAAVLGLDAVTGSIDVGKHADFAILTANPLTCGPSELAGIKTVATWIGGREVWHA
ncbi:MAG: amidohydrolase [Catenulispora sp.]|nr:amidohydrolase [Catenulispora sp.]